MTRVLVLFYSSYGHIETMANAVAEGARAAGAEVTLRRVPELVPDAVVKASGYRGSDIPVATVDELAEHDAIIVGAPTRFGRVASQMANFWDQTGGLWFQGRLVGKVGAAFTSTASQHGGQETTLVSILTTLIHHGMVIVGLPYSFRGQMRMDEIVGGAPWGATTLAGGDGSRQPSATDLEGARFLGQHVAGVAAKLAA
ncbi:MAG: NAD(P)H:quinone oxidoreductase [Sphingomonadaceae bacterium]